MEFNPNTIINDFQKIESLNPTTHELLTKLNLNLGYVAPELAIGLSKGSLQKKMCMFHDILQIG